MKTANGVLLAGFVLVVAAGRADLSGGAQTVPVGVARVDVTPDHPVRLVGYASRQTESEGVAQRLWGKALAIGADGGGGPDGGDGPAVLITVENCGGRAAMTDRIASKLGAKHGIRPERVVVCFTHNHTGPWLPGFVGLHSVSALPAEHQEHMQRYERRLEDLLVEVAERALAARRPATLSWAQGTLGFALNRRPVKDGRCPGLGKNPDGPVDHSLPLLRVTDAQGKLVALVLNYACHCTTLTSTFMQFHGDWAGCAQEYIEAEHPGAMALVCIGCGADANPEPRGELKMAEEHGRAAAAEVKRLLAGPFRPVVPQLSARRSRFPIPLDTLPTREEFQGRVAAGEAAKAGSMQKRAATHARAMLAQMEQGTLRGELDYQVTTWAFGDDLAMVFLPGEVVVDFALRLKKELDGSRLWVTAYTNDMPCYIVSRRILAEGGYEPDSSLVGYGIPARLSPAVEDLVIEAAKGLVPAGFATGR